MNEVMTLEDMKTHFDSEWVLVEDPEVDENLEVIRGKVLWHSKNRDEVYDKDLELRPKSAAYVYSGPPPDNILINL
jgi:hypothetical protein